MMMGFQWELFALLFNCFMYSAMRAEVVTTTTKSYDLEEDPIRIVDSDPLWATPKPNSRSWKGSYDGQDLDTKSKFSSSALRDFLKGYAAKVKTQDEPDGNQRGKEKKSWNMNQREPNNPYDDKSAWVTLEPLPWSLSKVSKWHSKPKLSEVYNSNDKSWENDYDYPNERPSTWRRPPQQNNYQYNYKPEPSSNQYNYKPEPSSNQYNYKPEASSHQYNYKPEPSSNKYNYKPEHTSQYNYKPEPSTNHNQYQSVYYDEDDRPMGRPSYQKPSSHYGQSAHNQPNPNRNPIKVNNYYKHEDCNHSENVAIITDGQPANFPNDHHYISNRRVGTELQPKTHPFVGEGEWVLLSTTKGYKVPRNRQRSLEVNPESIGAHRSVRLTVLPPLKDSNVNMTTSHGGLLQVESTSETVDQAQRKFTKAQNAKMKKRKSPRAGELTASTIATIPRSTGTDSSAVLAGVSAGILPATMAMLVPLAMNGRKRKRRETSLNPTPGVEITLPRYF